MIYGVSGDIDTIFCGEKSLKIDKKNSQYIADISSSGTKSLIYGKKRPKRKKIANISTDQCATGHSQKCHFFVLLKGWFGVQLIRPPGQACPLLM